MRTRQPAILAFLLACACAPGGQSDGRVLFEQTCARCHGRDGKGDPVEKARLAVPDMTAPEWQSRVTDDKIHRAVRMGTPSGRMPAFGSAYTEAQVNEMVKHIRTLRR